MTRTEGRRPAATLQPDDVIDWAGHRSVVRGVRLAPLLYKRGSVILDLEVADIGKRSGLHYWADEGVNMWHHLTEVEA